MSTPSFEPGFRIARVRAVHVRVRGEDYWRGMIGEGGSEASRFHFSPPWRSVYARVVETPLVRVQLDDGTIGWGEATCPIAPEVVCTLVNGFVAELVEGRAYDSVDALVDALYDAQRGRGYLAGHYQDAVAALDLALHDALGRRAGVPVAALLNPSPRAVLPCYLSGARAPTREARIDVLREWTQRGTPAVKMFLRGDLPADLDELAALRDAVPEIEWWAADALWSYDTPDVAARAKATLGQRGFRWLECPMLPEDLDGHVALQRLPGCPIALGEHFRTDLQALPWIASRAVDVLQPDVGRTGFVMARRIHAAARAQGIAVTPHMGGALDVMQAATLQFASAFDPGMPVEFQEGLFGRVPEALRTHWKLTPRGFVAPDTPGLGIEVDEAALHAHVVS